MRMVESLIALHNYVVLISSSYADTVASLEEEINNALSRIQYPDITTTTPTGTPITATYTPPPSPNTPSPRMAPAPPFRENSRNSNSHISPSTAAATIEEADLVAAEQQLSTVLKRAMSCDSVCSDTSVVLGDLEEPNISGYLCIGIEYDR